MTQSRGGNRCRCFRQRYDRTQEKNADKRLFGSSAVANEFCLGRELSARMSMSGLFRLSRRGVIVRRCRRHVTLKVRVG
jgi:hypothetical protein